MLTVVILGLTTWFNWQTLKTDDFTVIYKKEYYGEALHALQNLQYYKDNMQSIIGEGHRNLPVVIEDVGAVSNGFANPIFHNVHVFTHAPGFAYRMEGMESWPRTVTLHEYAHILHLSKTRGLSRILTDIFGPVFAPNLYSPGWITEGITVFCESQSSPYEGRLNDGFFDSYIGARVHGDAMPSVIEATNTPHDFPFGTYYLYGGEFFAFLAQKYGEDKFAEFFSRYGSYFWAPLSAVFPFSGLDIAARHTYGKSFPGLFHEWQQQEKDRYGAWQPAGLRITDQGWYMYSLQEEKGKLYYVRYRPVKVDGFSERILTHIVEFDPQDEKERIIASLSGVISTPMRIRDSNLYYTTREFAQGYSNVYYGGFGIVANLHERNIETGADRILLTDNIRGFCILPDGSILYSRDKAHGFGSEMWLLDGHDNRMLFETELLINELDANDEYIGVVARSDFENWNLYLLDYESRVFVSVINTPWVEGSISLAGDALLFTANYGKVYGIYCYGLSSGKVYQLTDGGYADHGVVIGENLYFKGMSKWGFDLYRSELHPRRIETPKAAPPVKPDFGEMELVIRRGGYGDVVKTLVPSVRVPFVLPTERDLSAWAYGLVFLGGDATDENIYGGFLYRDPDEEDMVFNLLWQSRFFTPLDISFFYDYKSSFEYTVSYPAFLSLEYGFSNLTLFLDGRIFDGLARKEFAPGCGISLRYPYTALSASFALPFERQAWGSDIHRSAQRMTCNLQQFLGGGEFRVLGRAYVDRHNPEIPDFSIRGYDTIESRRALILSTEYVHRLCPLRKGLWNPNVYVEDLYWAVFVDYAWTEEGTTYYSVGCELRLEAKAGFGFLQLVPKLGIALTESGKIQVFFGISPSIPI